MNLRFLLLPAFVLSLSALAGCSAAADDASTSSSNLEAGELGTPDLIPVNLAILARVRWDADKAENGVHGDSVVVFQVDDLAPTYLEADKQQLGVILPDGTNTTLSFASSLEDAPFAFSIPANASFATPGTTACADLAATATVKVDDLDLASDTASCSFTVVKSEPEVLPATTTNELPYKLHFGVFETDVTSADGAAQHHLRAAFILAERPAAPAPTTDETTTGEATVDATQQ